MYVHAGGDEQIKLITLHAYGLTKAHNFSITRGKPVQGQDGALQGTC